MPEACLLRGETLVTDEILPSPEWGILVGLRGNYAAVDAGEIEDDWSALVGSIRASWLGVEGLNVYGGVSQGFRAPNLSDLTRLDSARTNEIEVPSPGLDPERTTSFEVGSWLTNLCGRPARGASVAYC